jgi:membrane peptidoglycan carboxypeptidase
MAGTRKRKVHSGRLKRVLRWLLLLGLFGFVAGAATVAVAYTMIDVPDPNEDFQAQTTSVYYSDGKHKIGTFAVQNRTAVPLSKVPDHMQEAVVAAENRDFWTDSGIDPTGIIRAAYSNLRGESTQGASTITQQYVKNLYLTQEQTYTRKIKEIFLAVKLERQLSKEQILEGYLNTIYFGRGAYGVEAAAQAYFDKPARKLTVRESAVLASVLNSPGTLDPAVEKDNRAELKERYRYVLDGMAATGAIDGAKAAKLQRRLPKLAKDEDDDTLAGPKGHLVELVEEKLVEHKFTADEIYGGGLKVVTTLNWKAQRATETAVREQSPKGLKQLHIGVSSVEPGTGALRAMYGGRDYVQSQINWATAGGQPGSSFKAFALAAGLRAGFTLDTYFDGDSPYYLPDGGDVENQGFTDYGPTTLQEATTRSVNTAYVDMTLQMDHGPSRVIDAAEDAGVDEDPDDPLQPVGGVSLGAYNIPTVEMAEGYATFAANGKQADWYVLEKVTDSDGEVRYKHQDKSERRFSPDVAANVTAAMRRVIDNPHGTGHGAVGSFPRPAAGKTGTATSTGGTVSSSWFVGYTPQLSTAVMYVRGDGNDQLAGYLEPFYGGEYPARTWNEAMTGALKGKPIRGFMDPPDLEEETESTVEPPEPSYTPDPVYTPPTEEPSPTQSEPEPSPTPSPTPEPTPTPTPSESEPEPSPTPSQPDPTCGLLDPDCGGDDGGGGGGGGGGGEGGTEEPQSPPSTPPGRRE